MLPGSIPAASAFSLNRAGYSGQLRERISVPPHAAERAVADYRNKPNLNLAMRLEKLLFQATTPAVWQGVSEGEFQLVLAVPKSPMQAIARRRFRSADRPIFAAQR